MENIYRRIGFNTGIQVVGKIISLILGVVTIGFLTRYLGQQGFGNYTLVFTYLSFFGIIADCGLQLTMVRELSQKKLPASIYSTYFFIKLVLVIFSTLLAIILLAFFPYTTFLKIGIIIASIGFAVGSLNNFGSVIFQANLRLDLVTLTDILARAITTLFIFIFIFTNSGFYSILLTILIGNLASSLLIALLLKKFIGFKFNFGHSLAKKLIIKSMPIGFISVLALLYFKIDTLILSIYRDSSEVGIYGLAYKIIENILVLWGFYLASVYPLLSSFIGDKKNVSANNLMRKSFLAALGFGGIVIVFGYFLSPLVVEILGGEEFSQSILALRILLFSVPFFFINNLIYHNFLAKALMSRLFVAIGASLCVNLVLNLIFIPKYGYQAAAFNTLITEVFLSGIYFVSLKR